MRVVEAAMVAVVVEEGVPVLLVHDLVLVLVSVADASVVAVALS
jgi:hypothetical protein